MSPPPPPGPPRSLTLDRSQSAPDYVRRAGATTPVPTRPDFQSLPVPGSSSKAQNAEAPAEQPPLSSPSLTDLPEPLPTLEPAAQDLSEPAPLADKTGTPGPGCSDDTVAPVTEMGSGTRTENDPLIPHPEDGLPAQPMEQEEDTSDLPTDHQACLSSPCQPGGDGERGHLSPDPPPVTLEPCPSGSTPAEMESLPSHSRSSAPSERDQPDGERGPNSDPIPSLAQALLELHELLVSNRCDVSRSPSDRQDADGLDGSLDPPAAPGTPAPDATSQSSTSTATAAGEESCENEPATDSGRGTPPECDLSGSYIQEPSLGAKAEPGDGPREAELLCPSSSRRENTADGFGLEDVSESRGTVPEVEGFAPSSLQADLEVREPPEGHQGRGVADGRASGNDNLDNVSLQPEPAQQSPLAVASGLPDEDVSPCTSPPQTQASVLHQHPSSSPAPLSPTPLPLPFAGQFPSEHIQRILASGFSAREAVDALEQAQGSVELALLALLARKITVPT